MGSQLIWNLLWCLRLQGLLIFLHIKCERKKGFRHHSKHNSSFFYYFLNQKPLKTFKSHKSGFLFLINTKQLWNFKRKSLLTIGRWKSMGSQGTMRRGRGGKSLCQENVSKGNAQNRQLRAAAVSLRTPPPLGHWIPVMTAATGDIFLIVSVFVVTFSRKIHSFWQNDPISQDLVKALGFRVWWWRFNVPSGKEFPLIKNYTIGNFPKLEVFWDWECNKWKMPWCSL